MPRDVQVDEAELGRVLRSAEVSAAVLEVAGQVAANARAGIRSGQVYVRPYVTDRAAAAVTVAHPRALAWQARDGVLTRAAAAAGLEVRSR